MSCIARTLKVYTLMVLRWVKHFTEQTYEKPEPQEVLIVEIGEMYHYLCSKKQILDMESLLSRYRSAH